MASPSEDASLGQPYASAILLATFSLLLALLIFPPMLWHLSNRNIGAAALILWILILNLQDFLNATLWPHDDTTRWFQGYVLCDIEVKVIIAAAVGVPSSVACLLRALAKVMDTERATLGLTKAQRRRGYVVDLLWCAGFPALQMLFHYIVQTRRYYVVGISGCTPAVSRSWVADLLIIAPPIVWALVGGYYAALVLIRLHRYRRNFTTFLANNNTNKSRFVRLFSICILWLMISIPLQIFIVIQQAATPHTPFNWDLVHDPVVWQSIDLMRSNGRIAYTRYIWLAGAFAVFVFFGFGRDATKMYAKGLRAIRLDKCLPFLKDERLPARSTSHSGTINSVSSKARLLFGRKSSSPSQSTKSWATESRSSKATVSSMAEPLSPKAHHLATVQEGYGTPAFPEPAAGAFTSRLPAWLGGRRNVAADVEKNQQSALQRLTSPFRPANANRGQIVPMNNIMRTQDITVQSTVARDMV